MQGFLSNIIPACQTFTLLLPITLFKEPTDQIIRLLLACILRFDAERRWQLVIEVVEQGGTLFTSLLTMFISWIV